MRLFVVILFLSGCISSPASEPRDLDSGSEDVAPDVRSPDLNHDRSTDVEPEMGDDWLEPSLKRRALVTILNPTAVTLFDVPVFVDGGSNSQVADARTYLNGDRIVTDVIDGDTWVIVPELPVGPTVVELYFDGITSSANTARWPNYELVYHLNGDARDISEKNRLGVTSATTVEGKFGTALGFDGLQSVDIERFSEGFVPRGSMTIDAWVNVTTLDVPNRYIWFFRAQQTGPVLVLNNDVLNFDFDVNTQVGVEQANSTHTLVGVGWRHVGMVIDRENGTLTAYVNGVATEPSVLIQTKAEIIPPTATFKIGSSNSNAGFVGHIDEFRMYNGVRRPEWFEFQFRMGSENLITFEFEDRPTE